ncbi:MAG: hypothetical protein CVV10_04605 [Gammaproteobacteria bacterium HGW-Gammaproteobacteria-14]|nr:MAG: hypothetical protein CVV10_04605 [Gammaproteobacteria bacterium HGW-Gammaproteobacteria-14]
MQLDASSNTDYVYLNLERGEVIDLSAAQAAMSQEWHIAFRRFAVQLNGGASGSGEVAGALVGLQEDFYSEDGEPNASVFTNATPDSELAVLLADYENPDSWIKDKVVTLLTGPSAVDGGWYIYNPAGGTMSANSGNGWLLRSGEGNSYARMRATELTFNTRAGEGVESFTFEFDVQSPGSNAFNDTATFTGSLPAGGGELCFDFNANSLAACTGSSWDLKIAFWGRDFYLRSNGGVSGAGNGAVFGSFPWSELSLWSNATHDPNGVLVTARYQSDTTSGVFDQHSWYSYNLLGMHRLWPNYRTYMVDADQGDESSSRYLLQIIGYYDATGAGGFPVIRWRTLENGEI